MKFLLSAVCALLVSSAAASSSSRVDVRASHGWRAVHEPVRRDAQVEFSLGMLASDVSALDKAFNEITSPESPRFRKCVLPGGVGCGE